MHRPRHCLKLYKCKIRTEKGIHMTAQHRFLISHDLLRNFYSSGNPVGQFSIRANQRKHQSCASLTSVRRIHRWPVECPHKGPVTRKIFPFDDVIMIKQNLNIETEISVWPIVPASEVTSRWFFPYLQHISAFARHHTLTVTFWDRDKNMPFCRRHLIGFSWIKIFQFQMKFHGNMPLRV